MICQKLPGFEECLKYSILAKRSFLTFVRKDFIKDKEERERLEEETIAPQFLVQRAVSHLLHGLRYRCKIINEVSRPFVSFDEEADNNYKYDIRIIPDLNSLNVEEQKLLAKHMTIDYTLPEPLEGSEKPAQIFIGIVPWSVEDPEKLDDNVTKLHKTVLKPSILVMDWLKHKFWIAGSMPDETITSTHNNGNRNSSDTHLKVSIENIDHELDVEDVEEDKDDDISDTNDIPETVESIRIKNDFSEVYIEPSVRRYILDIMIHLRMHRLSYHSKGGGIIKDALDSMILLCKICSYDQGKMFVTPNIVKEMSFIYFPMHLVLINSARRDTSRLYGSSYKLIQEFLDNVSKVKLHMSDKLDNPLFLEYLVVQNVLNKIVPAI
ncbi:Mtc2p [Maudiozyma exigua]|uniref:Mtc2p n=1 Tax=Maudiozyma exigua TaxID=34358 RepID=A0A9P6W8B8_MAUEX|nr:Mtc2p [Kazachstania exigua]